MSFVRNNCVDTMSSKNISKNTDLSFIPILFKNQNEKKKLFHTRKNTDLPLLPQVSGGFLNFSSLEPYGTPLKLPPIIKNNKKKPIVSGEKSIRMYSPSST